MHAQEHYIGLETENSTTMGAHPSPKKKHCICSKENYIITDVESTTKKNLMSTAFHIGSCMILSAQGENSYV